jgi:hypothetical protein
VGVAFERYLGKHHERLTGTGHISANIRINPRRKDSPQSAQRPQRKALPSARAGITVPCLLTHSFIFVFSL